MNGPTPDTAYQWKQYRFNPLPQLTAQSLSLWIDMFDRGYLRQFSVLAEQIRERDDMLVVDIGKRLDETASLARKFQIVINDDIKEGSPLYAAAQKQKQALQHCFNNLRATDATDLNLKGGIRLLARQMLLAIFDRYSVHELVWKPSAQGLTVECRWVPVYFFDNTRGYLRYGGAASQLGTQPLEEDGWMVTVGAGLMKSLAICQMFKGLSLKDWLNYSQVYSEPGIHLETSATYGSKEWNDALAAVEAFRREFRLVTTAGQKFNAIEFSKTGDAPFAPMVERMDRRMSAICRGADLMTMSRHNSEGASLQDGESDILNEADCELVSETLNECISRVVIREVFGTDEMLVRLIITPDVQKDTTREVAVDTFLLNAGCEISKRDLMARYDRQPADEGDELAKLATPPKPGSLAADASKAAEEEPKLAASNEGEGHPFHGNQWTRVQVATHELRKGDVVHAPEGDRTVLTEPTATNFGKNRKVETDKGPLEAGKQALHNVSRPAGSKAGSKEAKANKWKEKASKEAQKKAGAIAPGTHERLADEAIHKVEESLKSGTPHVIDASEMLRSDSAITRHIGEQMHDAVIDPQTHARTTLDHAERDLYDLGRIGKQAHPEAWPAIQKIRAARERLGLDEGETAAHSNDRDDSLADLRQALGSDLAPACAALLRISNAQTDEELDSAVHHLSANFPHIISAVMAGHAGDGAFDRNSAQNLLNGLEGK